MDMKNDKIDMENLRESIKKNPCNIGFMNPANVPEDKTVCNGRGLLAVCVPTYNRTEALEEFFEVALEEFKKYNFDLYIYDSSEGFDIRDLVEKWMKNYSNLFYVKMPSSLHSNMKVYKIYQKYALRKDYKYLWMCGDSHLYKFYIFPLLLDAMKQNYDIVLLNNDDVEGLGNRVYTDALSLFRDCAWRMTLYGAVVLNCSTMLQDVDWNFLIDRYNKPERVNHSHVAFYFEKIYKMKLLKVLHLSLPDSFCVSTKKKSSGWQNNTFYVWGYCFPNAINALPSYYDSEKRTVIKKHGVYSGVFRLNSFINMRRSGIYDMNVYNAFFYDWKFLTNVPKRHLKKIARAERQSVNMLDDKKFLYKDLPAFVHIYKKLKKFVSKYKKLYVLGFEEIISRYSHYLDALGKEYEYLVISDINHKLHLVTNQGMSDLINFNFDDESSVGIVLAVDYDSLDKIKAAYFPGDKKNVFDTYIPSSFPLWQSCKYRKKIFKSRLKRFYNFAFQYERLYIYGAGKVAQRYAGYLDAKKIRFEAFVVTDRQSNPMELMGHKIVSIYDIDINDNVGIIMGMNFSNVLQVNKLDVIRKIKNIFDTYIPEIS